MQQQFDVARNTPSIAKQPPTTAQRFTRNLLHGTWKVAMPLSTISEQMIGELRTITRFLIEMVNHAMHGELIIVTKINEKQWLWIKPH